MSLLLNIDTATDTARVCISDDDFVLAREKSADQKNHASFIQPAIKNLLSKVGIHLVAIDAIAVTSGPGSYTGLRVGLSTAKGLCFALQKPLILINTLEVMAVAAIEETKIKQATANMLFCPMIDARRMEVFSAVYDENLKIILQPSAVILSENSFREYADNQVVVFFGNGSNKFKSITRISDAVFLNIEYYAQHVARLASEAFARKSFADLAYSEPFYIKEFFTHTQPPE